MAIKYTEIPTAAFLEELLPGKNLTTSQFRKIGKLRNYRVSDDKYTMYPALVGCGVDTTPLNDLLNLCIVSATKRCCASGSRSHGLQRRLTWARKGRR